MYDTGHHSLPTYRSHGWGTGSGWETMWLCVYIISEGTGVWWTIVELNLTVTLLNVNTIHIWNIWEWSLRKHEEGFFATFYSYQKQDGVGPNDNRPSTDLLHQFVWKKKKKLTPDKWHLDLTCDTWYVTPDMWHMVGGLHCLKISAL